MSTLPVRTASGRRAARNPKAAFLIAADENSLLDLEMLVATLPMCATGRIFIEVAEASQMFELVAPPRMTVTWLDRSRRSGAAGTGRACPQGQALTRAVTAWAEEMMCVEGDLTRVHLLAGFIATADISEHLTENIGVLRERVSMPAAYGL